MRFITGREMLENFECTVPEATKMHKFMCLPSKSCCCTHCYKDPNMHADCVCQVAHRSGSLRLQHHLHLKEPWPIYSHVQQHQMQSLVCNLGSEHLPYSHHQLNSSCPSSPDRRLLLHPSLYQPTDLTLEELGQDQCKERHWRYGGVVVTPLILTPIFE